MNNIIFSTATELAQAIRSRRISAVEALEAHLAHIARHNPSLNAIVYLDEAGARKRAQEADAALARGENWGALHGVPVTIKDFHAVAGMPSTWAGNPRLKDNIPTEDSVAPARLRAAGAVIMGISNMYYWKDSIYGPSKNPWDLERTPGTSSSGAGAALAAGLTPLDIGSDLSGSIVFPAHCNGVFGFRPTEQRVSMLGTVDTRPAFVWRILNTLGPMARSVADLRLAMALIAGSDGGDTTAPPVPWRDVPVPQMQDLRIAWRADLPGVRIGKDIRAAVEGLAAQLAATGAQVQQRFPEVDFVAQSKLARRMVTYLEDVFETRPPEKESAPVSLEDYLTGLHERDAFIAAWHQFLGEWDVFMCPVIGMTAPRQEDLSKGIFPIDGEELTYEQTGSPFMPFIVNGQPMVILPLALDSNGMPIGVMLVGRRWDDERLLAIAERLSECSGPFRRPPGY